MYTRQLRNQIVWIRMTEELKTWCQNQAEKDNRTLSSWIETQLKKVKKQHNI